MSFGSQILKTRTFKKIKNIFSWCKAGDQHVCTHSLQVNEMFLHAQTRFNLQQWGKVLEKSSGNYCPKIMYIKAQFHTNSYVIHLENALHYDYVIMNIPDDVTKWQINVFRYQGTRNPFFYEISTRYLILQSCIWVMHILYVH